MSRVLTFVAGASLLALALAACHSPGPIHSGRVLPGQTIAEDYRPDSPPVKMSTSSAVSQPDAVTRSQPVPSVPIKYPETP